MTLLAGDRQRMQRDREITDLRLIRGTENNDNSSVITGHGRTGRQFHAYHRACPKFPTAVETNPITRNSSGDRSGNTEAALRVQMLIIPSSFCLMPHAYFSFTDKPEIPRPANRRRDAG